MLIAELISSLRRGDQTTIRRILTTFAFAGACLCIGLGILGWGGFTGFFSNPARIVLTVLVFLTPAFIPFIPLASRATRLNHLNNSILSLVSLLQVYLSAYTDRINFWTIDGDAIRWFGVTLVAGGSLIRFWPNVIAASGTELPSDHSGHTLVKSGLHAVIRNPGRLGMLIVSLGWALSFRSGIGVLLTAIEILPVLEQIRAEERFLQELFGSEYEAYCLKTWRLIPWLY